MNDDRPTTGPAGWDCPHSRQARLLRDTRDRTSTIAADVEATEPLRPSVLCPGWFPTPNQPSAGSRGILSPNIIGSIDTHVDARTPMEGP